MADLKIFIYNDGTNSFEEALERITIRFKRKLSREVIPPTRYVAAKRKQPYTYVPLIFEIDRNDLEFAKQLVEKLPKYWSNIIKLDKK